MSYVYGAYNPKAPNGTSGPSQEAATSATGRKFAVMPKMGLGGLGYSKPPPKPAAASQAPIVPAASSPTPTAAAPSASSPAIPVPTTVSTSNTVIKRETPTPPEQQQQQNHQPLQQSRSHPQLQQQQHSVQPSRSHPLLQHTQPQMQHHHQYNPQMVKQEQPVYANQQNYDPPRPAPAVVRPVMRQGPSLGYGGAPVRLAPRSLGLGYGAVNSNNANLSLNVPLREPTPEPVPVVLEPVAVKQEYKIEDDYAVYGTVNDIDIQIRNVVCNYSLPLHIDLRRLAQNSNNVTFDRGRGVLLKQKRNPMCYVKIYSSGKVYIVGCRSEAECMTAARRIARNVQRAMNKLHEQVRIRNYRVCNVLATCKMPFGVKIEEVATAHPSESQYEPELSVGLVWRNKEPKATLRIHTTGSVTVTGAQSEADVFTVIERLYPILLKYKCPPRAKGELTLAQKRKREQAAMRRENSRYSSTYDGPRVKMGRMDSSAVVNGRVVFSDEEDEDDIYNDDFYKDEEDDL
ncbi:tlf-1 [Pristionchus pacificus]|uniref:TATA box-binding protein-like 1 n=1 Tax=Pristionchus pacificus TaxID=54126 RepID=A0A454XTP4_PRIPA|nr:tlf-1 [Pristionchus pacificus]|eukprot:PDM67346.1 tlf-1 [Pristionchus pacificus]